MKAAAFVALASLLVAGVALAAAPPPALPASGEDAPLPLWGDVKRGTLQNGLTYYILNHGKPEKRALLWLAVNAGSILEDDDQRGLAHFDEHMAFNGTKRFPKADIVNYLEKIGMRFGADLNAYTNFDETVYQLTVPTDDKAFIGKGLDVLRDWAGDVSYDATEVDKERGVVLEEWRLGRGAFERIFDKQAKVLFHGSRYADRLTIGLPETIKGAPRDTLKRFYEDWYRPDLMAVIAVGDFDPAAMETEIAARFGDLKNPAKERPRIRGEVPKVDADSISIESDPELPGASVSIYNIVKHRDESSARDFRRIVVEQVYETILNERMQVIGHRPEAAFASAGVGVQPLTREADAFARTAQVKGAKVEAALKTLLTEVARVEKHGFLQSELDRARAVTARFIEQAATSQATADSSEYTDEITRNFFEGELMIGRSAETELTLKYLPTITLPELNALAKTFGGANNRVILVAGNDPKVLPEKARVAAIVDEVARIGLAPWREKPIATSLMAKPPAAGKIVAEKKIDAIGVTEWTLKNGARVIVKPTDYEVDAVSIQASSPGGLSLASDQQFADARFASDVAHTGGVAALDAQEIDKILAGKHVQASTFIGATTEGLQGSGSVRDLETLLQLVHLRIAASRKDSEAFAVWQSNLSEQLTNMQRIPEVQFGEQSELALYNGNPRRAAPQPADVDKVNADAALAFYRGRFADVSDFTFVIVGAIDLAKLRPLVETYLASLPGNGRREAEKDLKIRPVPGVVKKEWKLGTEPKAHVDLFFHGDEKWSRDKDRDMFILGEVMSIRLREVLREDMGGVYGVGAYGSIERQPHQERGFSVHFGCAPDNVDKLVRAVFDEGAALAQSGIDADTLEKVKAAFVRERETELRQNAFWAGWLENSYRFGDDPTIVLDTSKMTARMTSDNVKASAKRYLDPTSVYQAVLLPK